MAGCTPMEIKKQAIDVRNAVQKFVNACNSLLVIYGKQSLILGEAIDKGGIVESDVCRKLFEYRQRYVDIQVDIRLSFGVLATSMERWADKTLTNEEEVSVNADVILNKLRDILNILNSI